MRSALLLTGAVLALGVACSGKTLPYAGGLMVAVQTDLKAPDDVSAVGLYITSDGRPIFGDTRDVAPNGEVKFPATIAVLADSDRPRAVVKIRAVAFKKNGDVRILRDIITTIPKGRTGLLRAPLLWINEGSGSGTRQQLIQSASLRPRNVTSDGFAQLKSACPDEQTFVDGECGDAHVDGDALPEYVEKDVFGGGDASGNGGRCFDVLACFAAPTQVPLDAASCTATLQGIDPNDPNLSFAAVLPSSAGTGECNGDKCFIPLDKNVVWKVSGSTIQFPRSLCARIEQQKALGVAVSRVCPTKDATTPSCGPASSVAGTSTPGTPTLPPNDAGGGDDGGGVDGGTVERQDFDTPVFYVGEPNLGTVKVDATYVYLARVDKGPSMDPGVLRLPKTNVVTNVTGGVQFLFNYSPSVTSMFTSIALDPSVTAQRAVIRGEDGDVRYCDLSSPVCFIGPGNYIGPREAIASGLQAGYAWGDQSGQKGVYEINYQDGTPTKFDILAGKFVASMVYTDGTLFFGMSDGSISKCTVPCTVEPTVIRPAPTSSATIVAVATSQKAPQKLFFMQAAQGNSPTTVGGVFEIQFDGTGEVQLAQGAEILDPTGASPQIGAVPLAADAEYVYWGAGFQLPGGGPTLGGLLRHSHTTPTVPTLPLKEPAQASDRVTGIAVDDTHVFWTYRRANNALVHAKKKGTF